MYYLFHSARIQHDQDVSKRPTLCGVAPHVILFVLFASGLAKAVGTGALTAQIPNLTVPAGGTAQIRVVLASPQSLMSGEIVMDLNPTVFGDIIAADVFSATGDQAGAVSTQGRHLDAQFSSALGGLGRLPGVPILVVAVPVLASAAAGTVSSITFQPGSTPWTDTQQVQYSVTVMPGTLTVGGSLSVQDVVPGGGLLPAGTMVEINGTGFTPDTTLQIDGASVASTQFVNAEEINFTLGAPADLTGKRLLLSNPGGSSIDYFSSLRGTFVSRPTTGPFATVQPIFPLQTYAAAVDAFSIGDFVFSDAIALENQTANTVSVALQEVSLDAGVLTSSTVTLPPGGISIQPGDNLAVPSEPIRMAVLLNSGGAGPVQATAIPVTTVGVSEDGSYVLPEPPPLTWNWQVGTGPPAPMSLAVTLNEPATPFTVSATTASGGHWLSISETHGTTCNQIENYPCPSASEFTASVNPSNLKPGVYQGSITITPDGGINPQPTVVPVIFNISTLPTVLVSSPLADLFTPTFGVAPPPVKLNVTSNGSKANFSVSFKTNSGKPWLSVTPTQGTTPATLILNGDPKLLSASLDDFATLTIVGPRNSQTVQVQFGSAPPLQPVQVTPASLQFFAESGHPAPAAQNVGVTPLTYSISFQTKNGGKWLQPTINHGNGSPYLIVNVDPTGLQPGTYQGSITISSAQAAGPTTVPVTLTVWTGTPPAVVVVPSSLNFTAPSGSGAASQTLSFSTGNLQLPFIYSVSPVGGGGWLFVTNSVNPTPTSITVSANADVLLPGTYQGSITITAPTDSTNSTVVPVTFTVTPAPPAPPPVAQTGPPLGVNLVNAASQIAGAVAPGEIITILGQNIGPAAPAYLTLGANGKIETNLQTATVLINGIAAPLLYAQSTQVNAIVPYEVAGSESVTVQVAWNGASSIAGGLPVVPTAPGIFTADSSGVGNAQALNQDGSVNGPSKPAVRGSTIQIYATGLGQTSPPGITGEFTGSDVKKPIAPVSLTIGGVNATVTNAASAPQAAAGLFLITVVVPENITPGPAVPIVLTAGAAQSQPGVTVAVQ